nr:aminotransferase [uncultured bacterium]
MGKTLTLAPWTRRAGRSTIQEMMSVANRPDVISFALGLPAAELFPAEDYARAVARVLSDEPRALQYGLPFEPLKKHVVSLMARRGVRCHAGQVFLTAGAQQGVSLLSRLLLDGGAAVLCEEFIYTGFQQAVEPYGARLLTVPTSADAGMDVDAVEGVLKAERPAFIYAIPDAHNPLGVSMGVAERERLVELARGYGVPIIEDDPYGFIHYGDEPAPPLRALEEEWVFYVGTFSKLLAPALRTGWVVVPEEVIPKLSVVKEAADINTCTLSQRAVAAYLDAGRLPEQLALLRREYRARRDLMLGALRKHFPADSRWRAPDGGLFIWVELARPFDGAALLRRAVEEEGVAFIPGAAFRVGGGARLSKGLRLNFTNCAPALLEEGVRRLARLISGVESREAAHHGSLSEV